MDSEELAGFIDTRSIATWAMRLIAFASIVFLLSAASGAYGAWLISMPIIESLLLGNATYERADLIDKSLGRASIVFFIVASVAFSKWFGRSYRNAILFGAKDKLFLPAKPVLIAQNSFLS